MKLYLVTKAPIGLEGSAEIIGAFTTSDKANAACIGAGTYTIATVELDRAYRGDLYDVRLKVVTAAAEFKA